MSAVASQPPMCVTSGFSPDSVFQPLSACGVGDPFFYHQFSDDFDQNDAYTTANTYTITLNSGTLAGTAVDGGAALFTTEGVATTGVVELQLVNASFSPPVAPKKLFYIARLQLNTPTTSSFVAGLITNGNVTPFTAVADGIYFKWIGGTGLTINSAVGSAVTSATIAPAAYTMAANTNIDLAFYVTRQGDVLAYVDTQLVGFVPQSNLATPGNPQNAGPVARLTAPTLTAVVLSPTLALQTNSAAAKTMTVDFHGVYKER